MSGLIQRNLTGVTPTNDTLVAYKSGTGKNEVTLTPNVRRVFVRPTTASDTVITFARASECPGMILTIHAMAAETSRAWAANNRVEFILEQGGSQIAGPDAAGEHAVYYSDGYKWMRLALGS